MQETHRSGKKQHCVPLTGDGPNLFPAQKTIFCFHHCWQDRPKRARGAAFKKGREGQVRPPLAKWHSCSTNAGSQKIPPRYPSNKHGSGGGRFHVKLRGRKGVGAVTLTPLGSTTDRRNPGDRTVRVTARASGARTPSSWIADEARRGLTNIRRSTGRI